jgi:hypothetical protein
LVAAGAEKRMNTVVLRDLAKLPTILMNWKAA